MGAHKNRLSIGFYEDRNYLSIIIKYAPYLFLWKMPGIEESLSYDIAAESVKAKH